MDKFKEWLSETGILKLLKSKRFWVALGGMAAVFGLELEPDDLEALLLVIGLLVGGYTLQDTAAAFNGK